VDFLFLLGIGGAKSSSSSRSTLHTSITLQDLFLDFDFNFFFLLFRFVFVSFYLTDSRSWSILCLSHKRLALAAHQLSKQLPAPSCWVGKDQGALVPPSRVIRGLQKCVHATSTLLNASL
jgi:hypothetical protein